MPPEDGAGRNTTVGGGGRTAGGGGGGILKKGPWTACEDAILMEYVKKHGEGNWNAVQRNSGLMRCGKSCRLRWANHLRPNLKKGAFTPEEERQIIELHSKFGNKWARMALHLQGRTDNEIKNYWNTRLKRRLRAGLPIYPVDFQQHRHNHHRSHHEPLLQNQTLPFSSSSSSSNHANTALNSISPMLFDPLSYGPVLNTPLYLPNSQSQFKLLRDTNGGVAAALSLPSQFTTSSRSSMSFFNHGFPTSNHGMNQIPSTMEASFNDVRLFETVENELPSIQSSFQAITPTCSSNTVNDHMIVPSNDGDNAISTYISPSGNSGLLEDVLGESRALLSSSQILSSNESKSPETDKGKEKFTCEYSLMEEPENVTLESVFEPRENKPTTLEDSSSGHSSIDIGVKSRSDVFDEINAMDDDFSSWLDFPTGSLQDWYGGSEDASTEKPVDASNRNMVGAENQVEISGSPVATTETDHEHDHDHEHDWTMGSCCWNNMPGFS